MIKDTFTITNMTILIILIGTMISGLFAIAYNSIKNKDINEKSDIISDLYELSVII